jgi:hypothetical protein
MAGLFWRWESKKPRLDHRRHFTCCGAEPKPVCYSAGSNAIELFRIFLFILPIIVNHFWRRSKESAEIIPLTFPSTQDGLRLTISDDPVVAIGLNA